MDDDIHTTLDTETPRWKCYLHNNKDELLYTSPWNKSVLTTLYCDDLMWLLQAVKKHTTAAAEGVLYFGSLGHNCRELNLKKSRCWQFTVNSRWTVIFGVRVPQVHNYFVKFVRCFYWVCKKNRTSFSLGILVKTNRHLQKTNEKHCNTASLILRDLICPRSAPSYCYVIAILCSSAIWSYFSMEKSLNT